MLIRYDPRDLAEIRVFHRNTFLCRAVNTDTAGHGCSLKEIQAARIAHRRALRAELATARAAVAEYLPALHVNQQPAPKMASDPASATPSRSRRSRRTTPTGSQLAVTGTAPPPAAPAAVPTASGIRLYVSDLDTHPALDDLDGDDHPTGPEEATPR